MISGKLFIIYTMLISVNQRKRWDRQKQELPFLIKQPQDHETYRLSYRRMPADMAAMRNTAVPTQTAGNILFRQDPSGFR